MASQVFYCAHTQQNRDTSADGCGLDPVAGIIRAQSHTGVRYRVWQTQMEFELQRCRSVLCRGAAKIKNRKRQDVPQSWQVEWCDETGDLSTPILRDGSVEPQRLKAVG